MSTPILATKLYIPPPRRKVVLRSHLIERLNEGLHSKLTLVSAPAGFGKTTLVSEWIADCKRPAAWLSLDEGDNDLIHFLSYFVASLQTIAGNLGESILAALQSPQPPPVEGILATLLNEIASLTDDFSFVLDDYHVIDSKPVQQALLFLLDRLPPRMHLVTVTREDPNLPVARLRAQGQLTELRVADLRFTTSEAEEFLTQVMGLTLSIKDIESLEARTEGWIAGLQLAAISVQGHQAPSTFIKSFTGSHHFVLDYLVEEVLHRQTPIIQTFLLRTSILDRLCGPLCDAVVLDFSVSGQETLEYLERANLFIVPLDNERRWYRYHHLFADLLRQRLHQSMISKPDEINELHSRASVWYEGNGFEVEAFHHAAVANDVERAARLIEDQRIPRHFRGAVTAILDWISSLPTTVLNATPSLWWSYAALMLVNGQTTGVEEKLQAAEAALPDTNFDDHTRNLIGQIATARATLALTKYQVETIIVQAHRALEYLHPNNLAYRATVMWTLGYAYYLQGDRALAGQVYSEAVAVSRASRDTFSIILTTIGLGNVQELDNQLYLAAGTYRDILQLAGNHPIQIIYEAHLGLARVLYEWNDLDAAEKHGQQSLQFAQQYDSVIDRFVLCQLFLARLKLAQGDVSGAAAILDEANHFAQRHNFVHRIPEIAAAQVLLLLRRGDIVTAAQLAHTHNLLLCEARVYLAQGNTSAALTVLETFRQQLEAKDWADERLRAMVLQAITLYAHSEKNNAMQLLGDALTLAEPGGFIRLFVDEGPPMAALLYEALSQSISPDYVRKLLAAFPGNEQNASRTKSIGNDLAEPLSERELEVLQLIAAGLTNQEIATKLFLSLHTVKVHVRNINAKLGASNRTHAVAIGRAMSILSS